jgi:hypothetical protein
MIVSDIQGAYAAGKVQILVAVHVNDESAVPFFWIYVVIGIQSSWKIALAQSIQVVSAGTNSRSSR